MQAGPQSEMKHYFSRQKKALLHCSESTFVHQVKQQAAQGWLVTDTERCAYTATTLNMGRVHMRS